MKKLKWGFIKSLNRWETTEGGWSITLIGGRWQLLDGNYFVGYFKKWNLSSAKKVAQLIHNG